MSFNRENVIWPSRDGTWNRAFWDCYITGDDPEWDVEYTSNFSWVRRGLSSKDAAERCWDGANPGGSWIHTEPSDETDRLDAKAAEWVAANPPLSRRNFRSFY